MTELPDHLEKAINEIDASIFSGDLFFDEEPRRAMQYYLDRWNRGLVSAAEIGSEDDEAEIGNEDDEAFEI